MHSWLALCRKLSGFNHLFTTSEKLLLLLLLLQLLHDTAWPGFQLNKLSPEPGVNELPSRPTDDEMVISYRTAALLCVLHPKHTTVTCAGAPLLALSSMGGSFTDSRMVPDFA